MPSSEWYVAVQKFDNLWTCCPWDNDPALMNSVDGVLLLIWSSSTNGWKERVLYVPDQYIYFDNVRVTLPSAVSDWSLY